MSLVRTLGIAAIAGAVAIGAYYLGRERGQAAPAPRVAARPVTEPSTAPAAQAPVAPGAPAAPAKVAAPPVVNKMSALMTELTRARTLKEIHDRLAAKADRTPEENYALAEIMMRCGRNVPKLGLPPRPQYGGDEKKRLFAEALSPKDPQRERRITAFEEINVDPCTGLENNDFKQADMRALVQAAAAAGDPKARAVQIMQDLWDQMRHDPKKPGPRAMNISEGQLDTLRGIFGSDDPQAITQAARVLQMNIENLSVRVGPGETTLDNTAFHFAAQFLACDLGNPCGRDSPFVLEQCAMNGSCAAADYREHTYFYNLSPASVQTMQEYYNQLQRARAGDWSYFTFHRGQGPRAATANRPR